MSKFKVGDTVSVNLVGKKRWNAVALNQKFLVLSIIKVWECYYELLCIDKLWQGGHDGYSHNNDVHTKYINKDYPNSHWYFREDQVDLFSSKEITEEDMW